MNRAMLASMLVRRARMNTRAGRNPLRKRLPRAQQPDLIRGKYAMEILHAIAPMKRAVDTYVMPMLQGLIESAQAERQDAGEAARGRNVVKLAEASFNDQMRSMGGAAKAIAEQTSSFQRAQLQRQLSAAVSVEVPIRDPNLGPKIELFTVENVSLIESIPERYFDEIEDLVLEGVQGGRRWESIAKDIQDRYKVGQSRANLIARDQVGKFYGSLAKTRQKSLGITSYVWRTMNDERVREEHADREGEVFEWSSPPEDGHPGEPVNCVPGTSRVSFYAPTLKAYRYAYRGDLTELVSGSLEPLRVTPNHPVLTGRGWLPAKFVEVGDHLIETPMHGVNASVHDPKSRNAQAQEMFGALSSVGILHGRRRLAAGFHGDAVDKDVDVVEVDWGLLLEVFASRAKRGDQDRLSRATHLALGLGHVPANLIALSNAANRIVSRSGPFSALLLGGSIHSELVRDAAAAWRHAVLQESSAHDRSSDIERLGEGILGMPGAVERYDLKGREVDEIVRPHFDGDVFNFETTTGWFGVHGRLVHNCRCFAEPNFEQVLADLDVDLEDDDLSPEDDNEAA